MQLIGCVDLTSEELIKEKNIAAVKLKYLSLKMFLHESFVDAELQANVIVGVQALVNTTLLIQTILFVIQTFKEPRK
jgi:hypothetical protein